MERGEQQRGREIIRTVTRDPGGGDLGEGTANPAASGTNTTPTARNTSFGASNYGPHRLVLEDAKGTKVVGMELKRIEGIGIEKLSIGAKLVLKNATVARGMVLLDPSNAAILGGKIDAMDKEWREKRKARLLAKLEQLQPPET